MKISELEPFVLFIKLKPIHLIYERGNQIKWLVCVDERYQRLVVYDANGHAYVTEWGKSPFSEDDLDNLSVRKGAQVNAVYINKYEAYIYPWLDYDSEWYAKVKKTNETPCISRETAQENTSSRT